MSNRCRRRRRLPVFSDPSPVSFRPPKAASRAVCLKGDIVISEGKKDLRAGLDKGKTSEGSPKMCFPTEPRLGGTRSIRSQSARPIHHQFLGSIFIAPNRNPIDKTFARRWGRGRDQCYDCYLHTRFPQGLFWGGFPVVIGTLHLDMRAGKI